MGDDKRRKPTRRDRTRPVGAAGRVAKALWPRVAELRAEGKSATEIGEEIARDRSAVVRTLKEAEVVAAVERIQADRRRELDQDIRATAAKAWRKLDKLIDDPSPAIALAASRDALDRAGIVARKEVTVTTADHQQPAQPADVTTPAGMAALREQLAALPPRLLEEALESIRQRVGA